MYTTREKEKMIKLKSFGHINVVVDDLDKATRFYQASLGAIPVQELAHFKNPGFARAAGFLANPAEVEVSIRFVALPLPSPILLELMQYHLPRGENTIRHFKTNDLGGPRHICIRVENVMEAFEHLKSFAEVRMIDGSTAYAPCKLDPIQPEDVRFFDPGMEANKEKICEIASTIKYFYCIDPYGIQWEIEEGADFQ
jgi:maltose O-acetyltransferase